MAHRTLRETAEAADAARFVGRDAELRIVREVLDVTTPSRVLFVHGPGGIGKSALLRAAARLAEDAGFVVSRFDARTLPGEFDRLVARVRRGQGEQSCIVIDEIDALGSALRPLRDRLLDVLPDSARLVLAGRRGPEQSWREAALDAIVVELSLRPLSNAEASELLTSQGIDPVRVADIMAWARGFPLALTVAASTPEGRTVGQGPAELEQRLTEWLAGRSILDVPKDVLEVAAIARTVDARMLAAALPGRSTRDAFRRLGALPVVEPVDGGVALHAVLAGAIRDRLRRAEPGRSRLLVRRIAEHLATRARLGDTGALIELSLLIESAELRRALANDPSDAYYADGARPGELAEFSRAHGFDSGRDWPEVLAWMQARPEHALVMRRVDGAALLFGAFTPVGQLTEHGPVTRGLMVAAERTKADPSRSFAGVVLFADASVSNRAEAARLGSGAMMRQHGVPDIRSILIHYPQPDRRPPETAAIAIAVPGRLARSVAISDFGPGGAVGFIEGVVLSENGFEPRGAGRAGLLVDDDDPERIARLRQVLDEVFGSSPKEQRLRRAIELVHLDSRRSEEECLEELFVSRRSWYRLLRTARERVLTSD